jgi:hypothetical protein
VFAITGYASGGDSGEEAGPKRHLILASGGTSVTCWDAVTGERLPLKEPASAHPTPDTRYLSDRRGQHVCEIHCFPPTADGSRTVALRCGEGSTGGSSGQYWKIFSVDRDSSELEFVRQFGMLRNPQGHYPPSLLFTATYFAEQTPHLAYTADDSLLIEIGRLDVDNEDTASVKPQAVNAIEGPRGRVTL